MIAQGRRSEPEALRRGKAFHKRVQSDLEKTATNGKINLEHVIDLHKISPGLKRIRRGRLDLFVNELGDFVSVVEIKSTDWDSVRPKNRRRLLSSHRRQVWRYIEKYLDEERVDVCPGIIYPQVPRTPGLREEIEKYLNDYGLQVVWYDE